MMGVKETLCSSCRYLQFCSFKHDFLLAQKERDRFSASLKCNHWASIDEVRKAIINEMTWEADKEGAVIMCDFCTMKGLKGVNSCKLIDGISLDLGTVKYFLQILLWLEKNNDNEFLLTNELVTNNGESIGKISKRIKFCPVCGKELK